MKSKLIKKRKEEKLPKQCLKWFHREYDNEGKGFGRITIKKAHNHYGYTSILFIKIKYVLRTLDFQKYKWTIL